jgi:hypothetical protein
MRWSSLGLRLNDASELPNPAVREEMKKMGCGSFGTNKILIGLHLVGLIGLDNALLKARQSGITDRTALQNELLADVAADNYIPPGSTQLYQRALLREFLRFQGEDFSEFYSEIEVNVTGNPDTDRDQFLQMMGTVFRHLELTPVIEYSPARTTELNPQLWIGGEAIVVGQQSYEKFKTAVHRTISDW